MDYDEIKKWLGDNNYQNSGLRTDRNHRIDLYLSDVLFDFTQQQAKKLQQPPVLKSVCDDCTAYPFDERGKTPLCSTCKYNPKQTVL